MADGVGNPFASGNMMFVPDGVKDNKLVDPVWLMKKNPEVPPGGEKDPVNGGSSGCNAMGLVGLLAGLALIPTLRKR